MEKTNITVVNEEEERNKIKQDRITYNQMLQEIAKNLKDNSNGLEVVVETQESPDNTQQIYIQRLKSRSKLAYFSPYNLEKNEELKYLTIDVYDKKVSQIIENIVKNYSDKYNNLLGIQIKEKTNI